MAHYAPVQKPGTPTTETDESSDSNSHCVSFENKLYYQCGKSFRFKRELKIDDNVPELEYDEDTEVLLLKRNGKDLKLRDIDSICNNNIYYNKTLKIYLRQYKDNKDKFIQINNNNNNIQYHEIDGYFRNIFGKLYFRSVYSYHENQLINQMNEMKINNNQNDNEMEIDNENEMKNQNQNQNQNNNQNNNEMKGNDDVILID